MEPLGSYITSEVADALDWPRQSAFNVLDDLADEGMIRKKKPEARRVIWIHEE